MSIGSFTLIKNEFDWIAPHVLRVLPHIDQMVFFDGNSTDGTLEFLKRVRKEDPNGYKLVIKEKKDPVDLQDAYVQMFNDCLWTLETDLAIFLHPDMWVVNPEMLRDAARSSAVAMSCEMTCFAGEPGHRLYRIESGRKPSWKNIYRLRNPDLGAHYHGHYGAHDEDVFFSALTGNEYIRADSPLSEYPYWIEESGIKIYHYSDVRPYARRLGRMKSCLVNQGFDQATIDAEAPTHPRVSLKDDEVFKFVPASYPKEFLEIQMKHGRATCIVPS